MYKELSSRFSEKICRILLALTSMPFLLLAGCAGGGATYPTPTANTNVSILAAATTNDSVGFYDLVVKNLSLVSQSGAVASLISSPVQAEFIHLNGPVEPIATAPVPQGVYTSAAITVGDYNILCTELAAQGGLQGQGLWRSSCLIRHARSDRLPATSNSKCIPAIIWSSHSIPARRNSMPCRESWAR